MLIIPIENKPNWQRPPLACISLVLLNLLIFAFYQSGDEARAHTTSIQYKAQRLLPMERPAYAEYLLASALRERAESAKELGAEAIGTTEEKREQKNQLQAQIHQKLQQLSDHGLMTMLLRDRAFDVYLRDHWQKATQPIAALSHWQYQRSHIEALRDLDSAYRFGITPAEPSALNLISTQFMHGSWGHVLGNMVFLCLFGFTLELALGALPFLGLYLLSGVAASALYVGVNWGSFTPAVGASGAVSGLMGMYLALYRLQRIRFFYNFAFYFGEFKAPALVILPLWVGKELYGYFFTDTNIAYWAHIGGLMAGVLLLLALRDRLIKINTDQLIDHQQQQSDAIGPQLAQIKRAIGELKIPEAQRLARQLCKSQPGYPLVWQTAFDLFKRQANSRAFHQYSFELFKHACQQQGLDPQVRKEQWLQLIDTCLREYRQLAQPPLALNAGLSTLLAHTLIRNGEVVIAGEMASHALTQGGHSGSLKKLLIKLIEYHNKRQQLEQAQYFSGQLKALID